MTSGDGVVARGEIYWVDLGPTVTSAPAKRRPAVVVQGDHFNSSRLATVIVAAVSSNTALADQPGNVFLPASSTGLTKDSVLNVTALATIDKGDLIERVGAIPYYLLAEMDGGLRTVLGLLGVRRAPTVGDVRPARYPRRMGQERLGSSATWPRANTRRSTGAPVRRREGAVHRPPAAGRDPGRAGHTAGGSRSSSSGAT